MESIISIYTCIFMKYELLKIGYLGKSYIKFLRDYHLTIIHIPLKIFQQRFRF